MIAATTPGWLVARLVFWALAVQGAIAGLDWALGRTGLVAPAGSGGMRFLVDLAMQGLASLAYLLVCRREAAVLAPGDHRAALGFARVRWGRVAAIGIPGVLVNFVLAAMVVTWFPEVAAGLATPAAHPGAQLGGSLGVLLLGLWAGLVAPAVEELFFRGWLWTGLRRAWGPWATGAVTGVLFAAAHVQQGVAKSLMLLPVAALLALVRHAGGGVGGGIAVHILNNSPLLLGAIALAIMGVPG